MQIAKKIQISGLKVLKIIPIILFLGIFIGLLRAKKNFNFDAFLTEIFYGNNFSDIRDGAKILRGTEIKEINFVYGKTFLAGLISFIPSSISSFKKTWAWGRFTTYYLFGMTHHFGMRGGNSLEAYINFGYIGVIAFAIIQGFLYALLEKIFYNKFLLNNQNLW